MNLSDHIRSLEKVAKENERLRHLVHTSGTALSEFRLSPSLPADSDDTADVILRQELPVFGNISTQAPTPRELEGVHINGSTILGLFEQYVLTLWIKPLKPTSSNAKCCWKFCESLSAPFSYIGFGKAYRFHLE